jgi:superfamily II DNA or RNA helicase
MKVNLRDYQIQGIKEITDEWDTYRSILFQMPTGTGKTTLFCDIVSKFINDYPNKKVLIVTHRRELVKQVADRLANFNLPAGIIIPNQMLIETQIHVASIQTLIRRVEHLNDNYSLVVIDEAHHALAKTYKSLWEFYPSSKFLGVTATPIRTNGEGFQDLFEKLIISQNLKWFINNKYLCDIRYFANHSPDVSNLKIIAGDYDELELSELMQDNNIIADLVQSYIDFALDKKIIIYAVNRTHCAKIVKTFNENGFVAKSIDTYTPIDERNTIVNEFRNNVFKILCNVNIFTEGFDCPDVDGVQLARPTKSMTLFLQQIGRCMRPSKNKNYGIILDNAGLWKEHGLPKMDRNWSLKGIDKDFCPSKNAILGIKDNLNNSENYPIESKSLRLVEIGELDELDTSLTVSYGDIEKCLIDKKILTMNEKINQLLYEIAELEKAKVNQADVVKHAIENSIVEKRKELDDLQNNLQPMRLEQVFELVSKSCTDIIENNDIFIEGDKDIFLNKFTPPKFDADSEPDTSLPPDDYIEIYHMFGNSKEIAYFNPATQRFKYENKDYNNPNKQSLLAKGKYGQHGATQNGWDFWFYDDENGVRRAIKILRR